MDLQSKTTALLRFLKDTATLRRKRVPAYGAGDKLLWFGEVPRDLPECRSAFHVDNPTEFPDQWLEIRKKRMPARPSVPELVKDWVRPEDLDRWEQEPELLPEITVLVEIRVPDPDAPPEQDRTATQNIPEVRRLEDNPEMQNAWLEYLAKWEPWAQEMRRWQEVQVVYEDVDFMRRRLEEAEERYELVLAMGLLQWRDSTGATVRRHLLTAPAEISLDAARGVLTVGPAASFEKFRIELDMLELQNQPRLEGAGLDDRLEELDIQAWDRGKVGDILRVIANRASPDAQVDESTLRPLERTDETFRVVYTPALVLRERRPTAYDELIGGLLKISEGDSSPPTTGPWAHFVREGEPSSDPDDGPPHDDFGSGDADGRLYFPLPTNEEQRRIASSLRAQPCVLVKGPPGTGKSHTIANLICHLLASGERVLVTAQAPKALNVLRDLLPGDIRNLCVTALGSTRDDQQLLGDSVRGILSRKNEWKGEKWAQEKIAELEHQLRQLEDRRAQVERDLREGREAETHSHTLLGDYQGTAAQIARRVEVDRETYDWFPELADDHSRHQLQPAEIALLADVHCQLTEERLSELSLDVGNVPLPDPEAFRQAIAKLEVAKRAAEAARTGLPQEKLEALQTLSDVSLDTCRTFLNDLGGCAARANPVLGNLTDEILKDLLVGQESRWNRLAQDVAVLLESMNAARERAGRARVDLPPDVPNEHLLADARKRLGHFQKGGRRGWGFLAPRVVRETRYLEEGCQVDGQQPREPQSLEKLVAFIEVTTLAYQFVQVWPGSTTQTVLNRPDPRDAAAGAEDLTEELLHLLELFKNEGSAALAPVPIEERMGLAQPAERAKSLALIEAQLAIRLADQASKPFEDWLRSIRSMPGDKVHPCMDQLAQAIEQRDPKKWRTGSETRGRLQAEQQRFHRYLELVDRLEQACRGLANLLNSSQGKPEWKERLRQLEKAWAWSAARAWLRRVTSGDTYERLRNEGHRLQDKIEKAIEELAALKAWQAFFERLDPLTEQNLTAWTRAVDRIGKGTGKYAYRHRRTARQYAMACIPKIPAWIMPLHKLWDTANAEPGLFDTVIIDEASQAGIESLALLLLAKRIIVVGDDKQNSPEAVGILEDDIERLARDHLGEFRFRAQFRPDTSLFDHAERGFGNLISLREHFRCVPEIIRFSNELCYTDSPLIPLRQPPPNRLEPLRATFTDTGSCEGEGQRIINRAEVDGIVETVQECLHDQAYKGKTIGVIVLQGHAQAELIDKKLAEVVEPKIREERKLRCGVPATFQGDQRDVIFLSLVVAPDHRSRALTGLSDQRRFNVAVSRARDQIWLFHSVQQHDLSREDLRWRLLNFFYGRGLEPEDYEEIDRLEREARRSPRNRGEQPAPYDSWFEVDVALELLRRTYRVRPQWKVAEKRIDLVVEGLENRLAVECYGDAWHGPEEYEHDMARQRQLERAGLTFVVIREAEFYADRDRAIQQIIEECERLGIRSVDQYEASPSEESAQEVSSAQSRTTVPASPTVPPPAVRPAPPSSARGDEPPARAEEEHGGTALTARSDSGADDGPAQAVDASDEARERTGLEGQPPALPRATANLDAARLQSGMEGNTGRSQHADLPLSDYAEYTGPPENDPRSVSPNAVSEGLVRIIEIEGPVVAKRVYDTYLRGCGIKRLGREIRGTMNKALAHAIRQERVVSEDEAAKGGLLFSVVRMTGSPPIKLRSRGPRSFEEIPPSELQLLARYVVERHGFASGSEDHLRAVLEFLDLKRLTTQVDTRFKEIMKISFPYVDEFLRSLQK